MEAIIKVHPEVAKHLNTTYDVHNCHYEELRAKVTMTLQLIRIRDAATRI